jgi:hypothetical protein
MLAKLELQGKKKNKAIRKKFQGNKIQQNKIRKYHHLFSLLKKKSPIKFPF